MNSEVKDGGTTPEQKIKAIRERNNARVARHKAKRPYGSPGEILRVYDSVTKDCEYLLKTVDRLEANNERLKALLSARQQKDDTP